MYSNSYMVTNMLYWLAQSVFAETPVVQTGYRGSWQGFRMNDGSTSVQQGIHLRVHGQWAGGVETYVDIMDGRVWGSETTPKTNKDQFANLYEGYLRLPFGTVNGYHQTLTVGKQEVVVNRERFLSRGNWGLYGRSFNGIVFRGRKDEESWQAGFLQLRDGDVYETTCAGQACSVVSHGDLLWFANWDTNWGDLDVQPYYLHLRENQTDTDWTIERRIHSPGVKLQQNWTSWFVMGDAAWQWGQASSTKEHQAWMAVGEIGYQKNKWKSSLYIEHNSGDGDLEDSIDQNFESFFGAYHGLRGWMDIVGGTNLQDAALRIQFPIVDHWTGIAHAHNFRMPEPTGQLYRHNKNVIGIGTGNDNPSLGQELDLIVLHKPLPGVSIKWAHSIFFPKGIKTETLGEEPIHFSYVWLVVDRGVQSRF
jgi:hypothetical protein